MERALLVGVRFPDAPRGSLQRSMDELARLAATAGMQCAHMIAQRRDRPDPATFVGFGKIDDLRTACVEHACSVIIFDDDLRPVQQKNLEDALQVRILDRTRLILDIFAARAHTREGILQVERARLAYLLPRLSKRGVQMDSQAGGIGTRRGPGERKLEMDARRIRDRIADLDAQIDDLRAHRSVARAQRSETGIRAIAIVGYTNAGKSTFLNHISKAASAYADDKLFATLDPTTRQVRLPGGTPALFTDTVGFIEKLPHALIASFRATLEEITAAHCLLHVVDAAHPDRAEQARTVHAVLRELGTRTLPVITVYNKADLLAPRMRAAIRRAGDLLVSARTGEGIPELLARIETCVTAGYSVHRVTVPYTRLSALSWARATAIVRAERFTSEGIDIEFLTPPAQWQRIRKALMA